jgi:hypothetical protein
MSQTAVARPAVRWRLGVGTRKGVLVVHIASAGAWLGVDVVMAVLVFRALLTDDGRAKALSFRALELIAVGPLLACGLLCLLSGILLGLGSRYGLLRYWWVAAKLALNLLLTGLVLVALARRWPTRPRGPDSSTPAWRCRWGWAT